MPADDMLPEGTDTIIEGAGVIGDREEGMALVDEIMAEPASPPRDAAPGETFESTRTMLLGRLDGLTGQATDKAREFVQMGKDRATSAIDDVARMIGDVAQEIDAKVGTQYGDYARRAAASVDDLSRSLKDKDVDTMFDDARGLISTSPPAAIGIAAVAGFLVARVVRSAFGVARPSTAVDA